MHSGCCYRWVGSTLACALVLGCHQWEGSGVIYPIGNSFPAGQPGAMQPHGGTYGPQAVTNTVYVPVGNPDLVWEQIVAVVDDYFRIERESRVQTVGNVVTEGRIDTFPQVGATWLEPHRPDSAGWDNRWESTFQTIRRRAVIRVIPQQGGYLIDAVVHKELEDLPRPENSTAGAASFRNDNSLRSRLDEQVDRTRLSDHWIPLGRDTMVEQQLLSEIRACVTGQSS